MLLDAIKTFWSYTNLPTDALAYIHTYTRVFKQLASQVEAKSVRKSRQNLASRPFTGLSFGLVLRGEGRDGTE